MTSSQRSWRFVPDKCRMTSLPADIAHAQSSLPRLWCPTQQDVYCVDEVGQRQVVVVLAVRCVPPARSADDTTMTSVDSTVSLFAEDLTTRPTRCSDSELQTNEELSRRGTLPRDRDLPDDPDAVTPPRFSWTNPLFGKSKSPKSYWLRRHSDSVFASADAGDPPQRVDEPSSSMDQLSPRTVDAEEFDVMVSVAIDSREHRFQSTDVGTQSVDDEVFDEGPPLVQSAHQDIGLQQSEEPTTTTAAYRQLEQSSSVHRRRGRLTVSSAGDLEDIDEESQSPADLDEVDCVTAADSSSSLLDDVAKQPLSDCIRSMELSGGDSLWRCCDHQDDDDDDDRKQMSDERETARPEAASARAVIRRRVSRVARSSRPSSSSGAESTSGGEEKVAGGGKVHCCVVCRRTFSRSDMLERHARLHTGVRPYACRLCTQVFSRSDHLTTHLRTHTGEKPYACPRCAYTASRRDMVTRHLRVHQSSPAAVQPAISEVVGPPRRRIYRARCKERSARPGVHRSSNTASFRSSPTKRQPEGTGYAPPGLLRLDDAAALCWSDTQRRDALTVPLLSPSPPPPSESAYRRRLEHIHALHALSRSIVARGSTGSTDSYSSPGCPSASDVFEFSAGGGSGVEGSPDVFRSPSSARQSTVFLFPYATASAALPVGDPTDSF